VKVRGDVPMLLIRNASNIPVRVRQTPKVIPALSGVRKVRFPGKTIQSVDKQQSVLFRFFPFCSFTSSPDEAVFFAGDKMNLC
jgi:hypothetical protein